MKKFLICFIFCLLLSGCSETTKNTKVPSIEQKVKAEVIKNDISCNELEKQTWNLENLDDIYKRIDYEERKKQIDYYFDRCVRENQDRWYALGLVAIEVSNQAESKQDKIKYLQISYENFNKSTIDDGFLTALQAIAIGKEYFKNDDYDNALKWFEKARFYYDKTNHTKLGALPEYIGDIDFAMGSYMTANGLYSEAYNNLCQEINYRNQEKCNTLITKINLTYDPLDK